MGFDQYNTLLKAKTVLGDEDDYEFRKAMVTAGALVAGAYYDTFEGAGIPAANTFPTGSNAFVACSGNNGAPTHNLIAAPNPASGKTRHLLYCELDTDVANGTGTLIFYDCEGFYPDFNLNANTTYNTGDAAATNRLTRYSGSSRVQLGIVMQVVGAGTLPTVTINYGDQSGNAGATAAQTLIAAAARGRYGINSWKVPLAAGDTGVRSVVSVVTAGGVGASGKIALLLMRKLGQVKVSTALVTAEKSFADPKNAFLFPRVKDNAAIGMAWRSSSTPTTPTLDGTLWWADGANPS